MYAIYIYVIKKKNISKDEWLIFKITLKNPLKIHEVNLTEVKYNVFPFALKTFPPFYLLKVLQ